MRKEKLVQFERENARKDALTKRVAEERQRELEHRDAERQAYMEK